MPAMITATTPLDELPYLVSIAGTARLMGRGRNTIYKAIERGQLETVEIGDVQMVTRGSIVSLLAGEPEKA